MDATALIRPPLSTPLLQVTAGVEAQTAFAAQPQAPEPPALGDLLLPAWSPYGALVRSARPPLHNFAAGALLFDAFA